MNEILSFLEHSAHQLNFFCFSGTLYQSDCCLLINL